MANTSHVKSKFLNKQKDEQVQIDSINLLDDSVDNIFEEINMSQEIKNDPKNKVRKKYVEIRRSPEREEAIDMQKEINSNNVRTISISRANTQNKNL